MTTDERLDRLEKSVGRYRKAMMSLVLVLVAGVTMAQGIGVRNGEFDSIVCKNLFITESGKIRDGGFPEGRILVFLGAGAPGGMTVEDRTGGVVAVSANDGLRGVEIYGRSADDTGGYVGILNKTNETIATLYADEYGNGVVGAWNRRGKGRTLKPGP